LTLGDDGEPVVGEDTISVLDATRQMKLGDELVLRAWADEDPEMKGLSLSQLAGRIYSHMAALHPTLAFHESEAASASGRETVDRLKLRIRKA
jgi:hypothetical protein